MRSRSVPRPIGAGLASVIEELGLGPGIRRVELVDRWPSIVGERIARVAHAVRVNRRTLFVQVGNPSWRNELVFLKKELIARLNGAMNAEVIDDIVFK